MLKISYRSKGIRRRTSLGLSLARTNQRPFTISKISIFLVSRFMVGSGLQMLVLIFFPCDFGAVIYK